MRALAIVMALGSTAAADIRWDRMEDRIQGGGFLHYEVSALHAIDDDPARMPGLREADDQLLAGVRMGAVLGAGAHVGYYVALDLLAGSTLGDRGFAYDVALLPVGIATRFGATGMVAVATGIGANGAVDTIDDAAIVPIQTTVELGRGIRLLGRARFSYVLGAANRQSGAPAIPFADEFDAMLGVRLGRSYRKFGFPSGNGYFLAVSYREQLGTRFVGATIGYSLDAALPRRFIDDEKRHREDNRRRRRKR